MHKGPIHIPFDALDRQLEFLGKHGGIPRFFGHLYIMLDNASSYVLGVHRFDSVTEFLGYQGKLQPGLSRVAFNDVEVARVTNDERFGTLELVVADRTGALDLKYKYQVDTYQGISSPPDRVNNPLIGAKEGDRIKVYEATYERGSRLRIMAAWHVRNDAHYARMLELRQNLCRRAEALQQAR